MPRYWTGWPGWPAQRPGVRCERHRVAQRRTRWRRRGQPGDVALLRTPRPARRTRAQPGRAPNLPGASRHRPANDQGSAAVGVHPRRGGRAAGGQRASPRGCRAAPKLVFRSTEQAAGGTTWAHPVPYGAIRSERPMRARHRLAPDITYPQLRRHRATFDGGTRHVPSGFGTKRSQVQILSPRTPKRPGHRLLTGTETWPFPWVSN